MNSELIIIGHRGAAGLVPENTLPSFRQAITLGCTYLELDVHCTADEKLAVIHDETLERTTNGRGLVANNTSVHLAALDAGGSHVPTLTEVIGIADMSRITINIELKGQGTGPLVAEFVAQHKGNYIVSSFNHDELRTFRQWDLKTPVALLYERWRPNWTDTAKELSATAINLSWRICSARRVQSIRASGFACYVYTVNSLRLAGRLKRFGVTGIFTDRPDRFLEPQAHS